MRTGYFVFLVLLSGCGDSAGTAAVDKAAWAGKLDVVKLMAVFREIVDAGPQPDAATCATRSELVSSVPDE